MGTYSKGILGSFTGKVGTVIGSSWRGKCADGHVILSGVEGDHRVRMCRCADVQMRGHPRKIEETHHAKARLRFPEASLRLSR